MTPSRSPGLLFASLTAFGLAVASVAGCCDAPAPVYPRSTEVGRSLAEQSAATADITVACLSPEVQIKGGSGVLVNPKKVITASHVVRCAGPTGIYLEFPGGAESQAIVSAIDFEGDIAVLILKTSVQLGPNAIIGPRPADRDRVCMVTGAPRRNLKCGLVTGFEEPPGDVRHNILTEPGNSGSGVYDGDGRLVGIVTHYTPSGGLFTALEGRPWSAR